MKYHNVIEQIATKSPHMAWIRQGTALLVRHGSMAYGTNVASSDEDIKGVCIPPKQYFFGTMHRFEQAELKAPDPDAVIYDIRKFFSLAAQNNPSIIEVLFVDNQDHLYVTDIGQKIIDNRDKFLSKRIRFSFAGYAHSQLNRIKLHRGYLLNPPKGYPTRLEMGLPEHTLIPQDQLSAAEADIQKELDRFDFDFLEEVSEPVKIGIRNIMAEMLAILKITTEEQWLSAARKIGLSDNFIEIMQKERAYKNLKSQWDKYQEWKKNRNPARAAMEEKFGYDGKHALHLIRLLRVCVEVLSTGKVIVKRPDREELLAIRNGHWSYDQLIEEAEKLDKQAEGLYKTSTILPKTPNFELLDRLCIELVERSLQIK
jgi:predicted nucleotidyltransferase